MRLRLFTASTAAAALLLLAACGKDGNQPGQNLLAYVPADSPYVFANLEPFDGQVRKAWLNSLGGTQIVDMYKSMLEQMSSDLDKPEAAAMMAQVSAIFEQLRPLADPDQSTPLGMAENPEVAFYGYGLLPVLRMRLADPAAFESAVKKMESASEKAMTTEQIGGYSVRRQEMDQLVVYIAAIEDQAVFALIPAAVDADMREQVLGLSLPEQSIADSGLLHKVAESYGFDPKAGVGVIDTVKLLDSLITPSAAGDKALLAIGNDLADQQPELDAVCQAEIRAMGAQMPRMVSGSTAFNATSMDSVSVIELVPSLAQSWSKVTAPQPGAKAARDAWAWFGFGIDPVKFATELRAMADKVAADPFHCEHLVDLNASMAQMKESLNPMAIGMAANFNGLFVSVDQIEVEMEALQPVTGKGVIALSSPAPAAVWALVKGQMASLSAIDIGVDKGVVAVPEDLFPLPLPAKALMTEKSLALALGDVDDQRIAAAAEVDASAQQAIVRYGVTGAFYTEFYGDFMTQALAKAAEDAKQAAVLAEGTEEGEEMANYQMSAEQQARFAEQMGAVTRAFGEALDYIDLRVVLTDKGVEMHQEMRLK